MKKQGEVVPRTARQLSMEIKESVGSRDKSNQRSQSNLPLLPNHSSTFERDRNSGRLDRLEANNKSLSGTASWLGAGGVRERSQESLYSTRREFGVVLAQIVFAAHENAGSGRSASRNGGRERLWAGAGPRGSRETQAQSTHYRQREDT